MKLLPILTAPFLLLALPVAALSVYPYQAPPTDGTPVIAESGYVAWIEGHSGEDESTMFMTEADHTMPQSWPVANHDGIPPRVKRIEEVTVCNMPIAVVTTETKLGGASPSVLVERHAVIHLGQYLGKAVAPQHPLWVVGEDGDPEGPLSEQLSPEIARMLPC